MTIREHITELKREGLGTCHEEPPEEALPAQGELYRRHDRSVVPPEEYETLRGARVLVVEDQPLNQEVIREILKQAGMYVECAANGLEAVTVVSARGETFEAILMDLQMPVMDGFEATRLIRAQGGAGGQIPIIAMTAHAMSEERERCRQAGMNGHLAKPVDVAKLFDCLSKSVRPAPRNAGPPQDDAIVSSSTGVLPDVLPGIQVAEGLARLRGNGGLYRHLVSDFCRNRRGAAAEIREALAAGDLTRCRNLAHALAGVAGNLGVTGVFAVAHELDLACTRGDAATVLRRIPELDDLLAEVFASAAILEEQSPVADSAAPPREFDPLAVTEMLRELGRYAVEHNLKSLKKVELLASMVAGTDYAPPVARLANALERLDFGAATSQINELLVMAAGEENG